MIEDFLEGQRHLSLDVALSIYGDAMFQGDEFSIEVMDFGEGWYRVRRSIRGRIWPDGHIERSMQSWYTVPPLSYMDAKTTIDALIPQATLSHEWEAALWMA